MTMGPILQRTLHPWEFREDILHEKVELWDSEWRDEWEHYSLLLYSEHDLHEALCDAIAEIKVRARHAEEEPPSYSIEEFQHLTRTLRKVEETGNMSLLQEDQDVIQRLSSAEQELFCRVIQKLFPSNLKDMVWVKDIILGDQE